jgi:hypothetical protein
MGRMPLCTRAGLTLIFLFSASVTAGMKIGNRLADYLILAHIYGRNAVASRGLRIVDSKPNLKISNGDVLHGYGFTHFLIMAGTFVTVGILLLVVTRSLLPAPLRSELDRLSDRKPDMPTPGLIPLILFIPLAGALLMMHSLWPNVIVLAGVVLLAWSPRFFAGRAQRI